MSGGLSRAEEVKPGSFFKATFDRLGAVLAAFVKKYVIVIRRRIKNV